MAPLASRVERRAPFLSFLAQELAPRESRGLAVARIAVGCTITLSIVFVLGMLQTYSPANDLTVLRDRIVGILLGNVVMTLVFRPSLENQDPRGRDS